MKTHDNYAHYATVRNLPISYYPYDFMGLPVVRLLSIDTKNPKFKMLNSGKNPDTIHDYSVAIMGDKAIFLKKLGVPHQ